MNYRPSVLENHTDFNLENKGKEVLTCERYTGNRVTVVIDGSEDSVCTLVAL